MRTLTLPELLEALRPKGRYVQVACDDESGLMFYVVRQLEKGWDRKIAEFILDDAAEEIIQRWWKQGHGEIMDGPYCSTFCHAANYKEIMKGFRCGWRDLAGAGEGSPGGLKSENSLMGEVFVSILLWLLSMAFLLAFVGYVLFVILAILFKAARFFLAYVRDATGRFIRTASFNLALWAVWGCRYGILRAGDALAPLFRPVIEHIRPKDPEEKMRELAALSNALKDARGILGLAETFSKDDLRRPTGALRNRSRRNRGERKGCC